MIKKILLGLSLLLSSIPLVAQGPWTFIAITHSSGAPVGGCFSNTLNQDDLTGNLYSCPAGAWTLVGGTAVLPVYLNAGTPTSQGNECAGVTQDASGHAITAVAALRTINASNVGHDVACVVTADALAPTNIGAIVFPFITAIGNAGPSQGGPGLLELVNTNPVKIFLENTSGTVRSNGISFRSCVGGCGTDFRMIEDVAGAGNEDMTWIGPSNSTLYVTFNCPSGCGTAFTSNVSARQFLMDDGTHDAKTNPELGIVNGHLAHGITGSNLDNWGTLILAGGAGTYNFSQSWDSPPLCQCNNPNQSGAAIACSASATTTILSIKSGAGTDTINYTCKGNPH